MQDLDFKHKTYSLKRKWLVIPIPNQPVIFEHGLVSEGRLNLLASYSDKRISVDIFSGGAERNVPLNLHWVQFKVTALQGTSACHFAPVPTVFHL
jgi:hypothetical protein